MDPEFEKQKKKNIAGQGRDERLKALSLEWLKLTAEYQYSYNYSWLGRPIIQYPHDILASQEIVWETRPDLIIETGIARGGSLIFWASLLQLMGSEGRVIGIDVDIREHNRVEIEAHPLFERISMLQGSSTDVAIVEQVRKLAEGHQRVMVVLDSNHSHEHVLKELELYSPLVTAGCYLIVFDTIVEFLPEDFVKDRPWGRGDNPYTAVQAFLKSNDRFETDTDLDDKLLVSVAPGGYLKCLR